MRKKAEPTEASIRMELELSFSRWNALACGECSDPFWADGVNMNLVRNHIIYFYRKLEEMGIVVRNLFGEPVDERPIPPKVPDNYVVQDGKYPERAVLRGDTRQAFVWGRSGEYSA